MQQSNTTRSAITHSANAIRWAYASAIWAFLFAAMSFYWALGGTFGVETLGTAFADPEVTGDTAFSAFVWLTAFLKVGLGMVALALVQRWGRIVPRRLLLIGIWGVGILLTFYGSALMVQHGLMLLGTVPVAQSLGSVALPWHFVFWDPFWLVGGILFVLAARYNSRASAS